MLYSEKGGYMKKSELVLMKLKNYEKQWKRILEQLVIERVKDNPSDKLVLEEINYWSGFFEISTTDLIFQVLQVKRENYNKVLRRQNKKLESEKYTEAKNKLLKKKKREYLRTKNLNQKIYYNKNQLVLESKKQNINVEDFTIRILGKNKMSYQRVIKDKTGKNRLSIGQYVNARLSNSYVEENYKELYQMISINISKVAKIRNIRLNSEDKNDLMQDGILYLLENGNMLNKQGNPVIKNKYTKYHNKIIMSKKVYAFLMQELSKHTYIHSQYSDSINYQQNNEVI